MTSQLSNYSPAWLSDALELPKDRATINAWARSAYALYPDINRIINQHAAIISGAYELVKCSDPAIDQFFVKQLSDLNFPTVLGQIVQEYFMLGEVILYLDLGEGSGRWERLIIQNPDYVIIKRTILGEETVFLRPDENLRRICFSNRAEDILLRNQISQTMVETIRKGENIKLDSFYCSHLSHKTSPYELRGTSFLMPLYPFLITSNNSKVGLSEEARQIIRQTLFDITAKWDKKSVVKEVLLANYDQLATMLEVWLNNKVIAPIAKIQGFQSDASSALTLPTVQFNRAKLRKLINAVK